MSLQRLQLPAIMQVTATKKVTASKMAPMHQGNVGSEVDTQYG